jgi:hypothetical protein
VRGEDWGGDWGRVLVLGILGSRHCMVVMVGWTGGGLEVDGEEKGIKGRHTYTCIRSIHLSCVGVCTLHKLCLR